MTGRDDVVFTALVEKKAVPHAPASCGVKCGCWLPGAGSIAFHRYPLSPPP
jgi:hypothetical protein